MQVLLPALLAVPMILTFISESPLLMILRKFTTSEDDDRPVPVRV
jgi:hypothetical protein